VAIAIVGGGVALAADGPDFYGAAGGGYVGVRPTAVGLPQIGMHGTVGAGELTDSLRHYHDDGLYAHDLAAVAGAAREYLDARLDAATAAATRTCHNRYHRYRIRGVGVKLYRRVRTCHTVAAQGLSGKPAIVLDIDETSLSNYDFLLLSNFTGLGLVPPAALGSGRAIAPTLALYREARKRGVAVFFVTGRPDLVRGPTESNLRSAGYDKGWDGLSFKPSGITTVDYKAGQRKQIEGRGYDIVVNLGDQESDLDDGHADRAFKLPNPFYFIGDR
jgi:hypothetical protein